MRNSYVTACPVAGCPWITPCPVHLGQDPVRKPPLKYDPSVSNHEFLRRFG